MKRIINKSYKLILIFIMIILFNSFKIYANEISVNAKSALIVETNTGKIIYEKDINEKRYPASVTKILTAIITIEKCDLDDVVTVSKSAISNIPSAYVIAPLYVGEQIKVKDLLYALMLKSSNDAAYVLAEHVGGSVEGFADIMNDKAKELGCKNSHFVNPNGIHDFNHYTTAYDMYLISNYAMKNETFAKIVSTYEYTLPATNKYPYRNRIMKNTNYFINTNSSYYDKRVRGIKTGTTDEAGKCLITESFSNGLNFITVILGAETENSRFSETRKMINYAFNNYTLTEVHKKGDKIQSIEVEKATKDTKNLNLIISEDITVMNNIKTNVDEIEKEVVLNDSIVAPIEKGKELGIVKYNVDEVEYTAKLLAENDVILKTYYLEVSVGIVVFAIIITGCMIIKKKRKVNKR